MSSSIRKVSRRVVVVTFALVLGALPFASAEAQRSRRESLIQQVPSVRTTVQALVGPLLAALDKMGWHPGFKPETSSQANPEGSSVCPNGKPGLQGNPNPGGN